MTHKQTPEPGSPIAKPKVATSRPSAAQLKRAAERLDALGDPKQADQFHRVAADLARAESKPVKRPKMTDEEQSAEFERLSRELDCDDDDEKFQGVLRKLAKPKSG